VRSGLGTGALIERVSAFRCGLDSTNWTDASKWPEASEDAKRAKDEQVARRERCKALTGTNVSDRAPPPFDVAKSHELYQALFGQVEDLIRNPDGTGKHLLVVPSGPLTQLPFQVLVTDKPRPGNSTDYARTAWLVKRHAITVLPSVASLKALRQNAKGSKAARPFVGFGNPLLVGLDGSDKSAFTRQACPKQAVKPEPIVVAGRKLPKRFARLVRGGVADVAALKHQAPLPETADELCAVARQLGADEREVNLGASATETRVKQLNGEGALGQARVLHFATHGLIASETESVAKSLAEPALLLTPPESATATDDGLLTASEVTELKLDADWVVLSACNTAAAGEDGSAEALSGLARAFFFAGARALLVSHWYVDSRAAVQITTTAFAELKRDPKIGRAEALRRAMLAVMNDRGRPRSLTPAAHPAVWAPFVVVGEGVGTTADSTSAMITGTKTQSPATASVPDATSSLQPVEVVPEPKAKGKAARRRKPTSEWDWFYDLW
jgi:CHAT domain-containing protein